jgi:hypothetical protein
MTYLPDINLWIALTLEDHVHHSPALRWFAGADDFIVFCRVTEMGFLRLLTNKHVMSKNVCSTRDAWRLLERIRRDERVLFASEPPGIGAAWQLTTSSMVKTSASFWTDAYLSAFVRMAGYVLVTFDRGFSQHRNLSVQVLN